MGQVKIFSSKKFKFRDASDFDGKRFEKEINEWLLKKKVDIKIVKVQFRLQENLYPIVMIHYTVTAIYENG